MAVKTCIAVHTSRYTICGWLREAVLDMGHRVVSNTYHRECSTRERQRMDTCPNCLKALERAKEEAS